MQPQSDSEYKSLLTDVIKKQIVILGPDITLVKARNVKGLVVNDDGTVVQITGLPQEITQNLIDQFVQLSGMIVKKTMEPLLSYHPQVPDVMPQSVQMPQASLQQIPQIPTMSPVQQPMQTSQMPAPTTGQTIAQQQPSVSSSTTNPDPTQIDTQTQKIINDAIAQGGQV